jgi:DNA processing protein
LDPSSLSCWLALHTVAALSGAHWRRLLAAFGSPARVLRESQQNLARVVEPALAQAIRRSADSPLVQAALDWSAQLNHVIVTLEDPRYPELLRETPDPPPVLWVRGDLSVLEQPSVAIVGSRGASQYAKTMARTLAAGLSHAGIVVTSGMARGVDAAAHAGCLDAGGRTMAVLGTGVDVIYPAEHAALTERVIRSGLLVSELEPGERPYAWHFPRRNRIISGLSRAVVVVEASEKSGSLITARMALEQGREVMAVPGSVLYGRNRGAHALIKDGAMPVEDAADILDALGYRGRPAEPTDGNGSALEGALQEAGPEGLDLDRLSKATGMEADAVLSALTALELDGRAERLTGGVYVGKSEGRRQKAEGRSKEWLKDS